VPKFRGFPTGTFRFVLPAGGGKIADRLFSVIASGTWPVSPCRRQLPAVTAVTPRPTA
jgi:hypothetical protein